MTVSQLQQPLFPSSCRRSFKRGNVVPWYRGPAMLLAFEDEMAEVKGEGIRHRRVYLRPDRFQSTWAVVFEAKEELIILSSR